MRRQLHAPPADHHQPRDRVGEEREAKRRRNLGERSDVRRRPVLNHQRRGDDDVAGEKQPRREGPPADPPLGECQIGAGVLIADVEQDHLADGGRGRGCELELRRFDEQWPTH